MKKKQGKNIPSSITQPKRSNRNSGKILDTESGVMYNSRVECIQLLGDDIKFKLRNRRFKRFKIL